MPTTASPARIPFTPANDVANGARTPAQTGCSRVSTIDTPTMLAGFQKVLTDTPSKRAARNHTSKLGNACKTPAGTPPPHAGVPSAHKARRTVATPSSRSKLAPTSSRSAIVTGSCKKRALFARGSAGSQESRTPQPNEQAESGRLGIAPLFAENDGTPDSCNSTPTKPPSEDAGATAPSDGSSTAVEGGVAAQGAENQAPTPFLAHGILTPSFLMGGSDRRPKAQRALGSRLEQVATASDTPATGVVRENRNTPRSFMRALSRKSRAVNSTAKKNTVADAASTPRSMVKSFISSGLRSADLKLDTPATLRRRSIRKAADAKEAARRAAETTPMQRMLHVILLLVLFTAFFIVFTNLCRPFRRVAQEFVFGDVNRVRYT